MISIERLREYFSYDSESGLIFRAHDELRERPIGAASPNGYLKLKCDGINIYAHRAAWALVHHAWPENDLDHINGERGDNRIANLRGARRHENLQNMRKRRAGNSGVRGITWDVQTQCWRAQLSVLGKRINIGRFKDKDVAEQAYLHAKRIHHPFSVEVA